MLKKIKHLIKFFNKLTIVYIDHEAALDIVKQTSLTTLSTDKLNLRLMRTLNYIQRFDFDIHCKSKKLHVIPDVLS